jgi:Protein of unknown function (DUF3108)
MARWLARFCVALLCVLAVHGVVLWGVSREILAITSVIQAAPDPLFTRLITQQGSAAGSGAAPTLPYAANAPQPMRKPAGSAALSAKPSMLQQSSPTLALADSVTTTATLTVTDSTPIETVTSYPSSTLALATTSLSTYTSNIANITASATTNAALSASSPAGTGTADASAALAQVGQWPGDTRLSYQLGGYFRGPLYGSAQVQWTRLPTTPSAGTGAVTAADAAAADRYQVRVSINVGPTGAQLTSQGLIRADGLLPQVYEEQLPNGGRRSATLDATGVSLHNGTRLPRPALEPLAVQDSASQFVDIGHRFAQGRARLVAGETLRIWLARPGGMDEWTYDIGPAETLYLPILGAVQAHHLKPRPLAAARGTITAEMWIAPSLQYLPVRVKVNLNSETHVDMLVKTIEQR